MGPSCKRRRLSPLVDRRAPTALLVANRGRNSRRRAELRRWSVFATPDSPGIHPIGCPFRKANVRDFEVYIDDERYGTPTLVFVQMSSERRVREFAQRKLEEDKRHRGVEVREDGVRLFGLGTLADPAGEGVPCA